MGDRITISDEQYTPATKSALLKNVANSSLGLVFKQQPAMSGLKLAAKPLIR